MFRKSGTGPTTEQDRKSTRLNSSHVAISYAVSCPTLRSVPTRRSSDLDSGGGQHRQDHSRDPGPTRTGSTVLRDQLRTRPFGNLNEPWAMSSSIAMPNVP